VTVEAVARRHYTLMQRIKAAAVAVARREWRKLPRGGYYEVQRAYAQSVGPQVLATVVLAQLAAADQADGYVGEILAQQLGPNREAPREGRINPDAFAGTAADGRPLDSLLWLPAARTLSALRRGDSVARALDIGETALSQIVATETADAGRTADGVAVTARRQLTGYVRMLTPPSCPRCVILAGRFYRWNAGFERHPLCDCIHVPAAEDTLDDIRTNPRDAVLLGQVEGLSKADERAIHDGADVSQVINAHRGMYTADGRKFTREGTTKRGYAAARFRGQTGRRIRQRLRPEQIYREANGNRDEALRLLELHGYLL
jgi:hypothetical protein